MVRVLHSHRQWDVPFRVQGLDVVEAECFEHSPVVPAEEAIFAEHWISVGGHTDLADQKWDPRTAEDLDAIWAVWPIHAISGSGRTLVIGYDEAAVGNIRWDPKGGKGRSLVGLNEHLFDLHLAHFGRAVAWKAENSTLLPYQL